MRSLSSDAGRLVLVGVVLVALAAVLALTVADLERTADASQAETAAESLRGDFIELSANQRSDLEFLLGVARGSELSPTSIQAGIDRVMSPDDPRGVSVWSVREGAPLRLAAGGTLRATEAARRAAVAARADRGLTLSRAPGGGGTIVFAVKDLSPEAGAAAVMEVPVSDATLSPPLGDPSATGQVWVGPPGSGRLLYSSTDGSALPPGGAERAIDLGSTTLTVVVRQRTGVPIVAILLAVMGVAFVLGLTGMALAARNRSRQNALLQSENASLTGRIRQSEDRRARSERDAQRDPLTGLPNRTVIMRALGQSIARAKRTREVSALLFIDLDGFKEVNDTLGHQAGDELLVSIARRLEQAFRGNDTVARFAGDEFCVLCEGVVDAGAAACLKIERLLAEPIYFEGTPLPVRASIGMALSGQLTEDPEAVLREADRAMYRAKQSGGGRVVVAAPVGTDDQA